MRKAFQFLASNRLQDSKSAPISSKMAKLWEKYSSLPSFKVGDKVEGRVLQVLKDSLIIDFAGKSEGIIRGREFLNLKKLGGLPQVGEKISAVIVNLEDETGATILSTRTTVSDSVWQKLEEVLAAKLEIEAKIKGLTKGGILLEVMGLRAFMPAGFGNPEILADFENFLGKKIKVKLVEVDKNLARLICKIDKKLASSEIKKLEKNYKTGEKYSGLITAIFPFGLTLKFNSFYAFVPNSEITWEKVDDPKKFFEVDQKADFVFLGVDQNSAKIQISLKKATPDPFEKIAEFNRGTVLAGTVSKISDFGIFVQLSEFELEGLIHISKLPPDKKFEVGQKISCTLDLVDKQERKIALSPVLTEKPVGYR